MKYEKYLVKRGKRDLLSSLKQLDKKIINEKLEEYGLKNINELKDYIIEEFETTLNMFKDDIYTQIYFARLLENENSECMTAYDQDIEDLFVFVYYDEGYYSYYVPTEIKRIIKDMLMEMTSEEQINLQNAPDAPIVKDLRKILNALAGEDLKGIGKLFFVSGMSKRRKKELVNAIYNALTNKDKLSEVIERFVDKEFDLLKQLLDNKGTIQNNKVSMEQYYFLYALGLVFIFKRDNKFYISMTDDVYNVIKKIDLKRYEKIIDDNTKVHNLIQAMVELYGVVSRAELDYYYSLYYGNGEDLDMPNNALYFCKRSDGIVQIDVDRNLYFANSILENRELEPILEDIIGRQLEIKRKPIKIDDLLKYLDDNYYEENDSKNKFKKYLRKKGISNKKIEEIILTISKMYRLGNKFIGGTINMLEDYGVEVTENNAQEILDYLIEIYNNTRVWTNNGWTPIEMRKEYER